MVESVTIVGLRCNLHGEEAGIRGPANLTNINDSKRS